MGASWAAFLEEGWVVNMVKNQVRDQVSRQIWHEVRHKIGDQIWDKVSGLVSKEGIDRVEYKVGSLVRVQVWEHVRRLPG